MQFVLLHHKVVTHKVIFRQVIIISFSLVIQIKFIYLNSETTMKSHQFQLSKN